jgi:hypothetical protein
MIQNHHARAARREDPSGTFEKIMNGLADGALATASALGTVLPGGGLLSAAANGLRALKDGSPNLSGGDDQLQQMWAMQRENQVFNMQYLQLQTELQSDNRRFSTMSNLMKARHDTAKSAINNMHV